VQRGQRRLDHVGTAPAERQRAIELGASRLDLIEIPARAVLLGQQHQLSVGEAGVAASVVDQHQGQQRAHLGLVGHQLGERAAEPDRLGRQVPATAVALVEDQVDDRQHGGKAVGEHVRRRDSERDAGVLDLAPRAHEPLGHRVLGDQEGASDLVGGEAAERAQRERDLRLQRERRVAAGHDQLEALVGDGGLVHRLLHYCRRLEQLGLLGERAVAADAVDRAVAGGGHEPGPRVVRRALARPALGGDRERVLGGLLGELEVAEEADQGRQDASPLVAEGLFEDG
jgi:hypothetical protein